MPKQELSRDKLPIQNKNLFPVSISGSKAPLMERLPIPGDFIRLKRRPLENIISSSRVLAINLKKNRSGLILAKNLRLISSCQPPAKNYRKLSFRENRPTSLPPR